MGSPLTRRRGLPPAPDPGAPSLWLEQVRADPADALRPRPGLDEDMDVDVVVVGAGLTGLWVAWYLLAADPRLQVLVLEQEVAGFGASGRNGGWCSALFPVSAATIAAAHGRDAALSMRAAMRETVHLVVDADVSEHLGADARLGGTIAVARSAVQLARARAEASEAAHWGDTVHLLTAEEAASSLGATDVVGGTLTVDCARVHPARLVRGLARAVEARGARLAERTRVVRIGPGEVLAEHDGAVRRVRARWVVRATEAWTARLPGQRRVVAPVYSLMVATEPLPSATWERIGLAPGRTFTDHRHLVVYGQRTPDDRLAFGGRGAPYHWASAIRAQHDDEPGVHAALRDAVTEMLPVLTEHRLTHRWGGPLAIARDWHASVGADPARGVAWAGGYVGDGVATANLAGRTLADLLTGRRTALTRLPWVGHRSPRWEPEPLRWLGVNAGLRAMTLADAEERVTRRPSILARAMAPLIGGH